MMKNTIAISSLLGMLAITGCGSEKLPEEKLPKGICAESSEWKDHNGPDRCSYYTKTESCAKLIGKLKILSRLHKNMLEEGVFEGGMSSRWMEIEKGSASYYKPNGELADEGTCSCKDGVLKIDWKKGDHVPEESTIYFRSADTVELRYYDHPFNFASLQYDKSKPATNPTKILGIIE